MEHTLMENDILIIEKISLLFSQPKQGDIVVFVEDEIVTDSYWTKIRVLYEDMAAKLTKNVQRTRLVKRVIGIPGDVVNIVDGYVYVNDKQLDEPYIEDLTFAKVVDYPITVAEGHYFVLGDNRDVSRDSRHFGVINEDQIEGLAVLRVAPLNHIGLID
jgi:signal peptidase I